jgi:hypothetical protein
MLLVVAALVAYAVAPRSAPAAVGRVGEPDGRIVRVPGLD